MSKKTTKNSICSNRFSCAYIQNLVWYWARDCPNERDSEEELSRMLEEAMNAVKKAEQDADAILEAAKEKAQDIRKKAGSDAEDLKVQAQDAAAAYLKNWLEKAGADGDAAIEKAKAEAGVEAEKLTEAAKAKEPEAIKAVIDEIVNKL